MTCRGDPRRAVWQEIPLLVVGGRAQHQVGLGGGKELLPQVLHGLHRHQLCRGVKMGQEPHQVKDIFS